MQRPSEDTMRRVAANLLAFTLDAVEAPRDPVVVADEDLEYWGRFFVANCLNARGILFETFMRDPFAIAQAALFGTPMPLPAGDEFYPLLPRQREAALQIHPRVRAVSRPLPEMHELMISAGLTMLPGTPVVADWQDVPVFLRKQAD